MVVSDNDGSAFITKAEFDSLKNNFQAQIDNYNQSIDSKMDGAIASYLAGIKVNTDDTPEYIVYGARYGSAPYIWDGRVANVIYLLSMGNNMLGKSSGYDDYFVEVDSNTRSNRGYGYGYWITGYKAGSAWFPTSINKGIVAENYNSWGGAEASETGVNWNTSHTATNRAGIITWSTSGLNWKTDFCNKELSDLFYTKISVYNPKFPLFQFYDAGEVTLYFAKCINGYAYEAGAQGGKDGAPRFMEQSSSSSENPRCMVELEHNGVISNKLDILAKNDQVWVPITLTVSAGDRVLLSCGGHSSGHSGCYCIIWFTHDIAGWKIREP